MSNDTRLHLVKSIMDEFTSKGTADLLFSRLAEDATWRTTAPAGTSIHQQFTGREGVAEYFRRVEELLIIEHINVSDYFENGDKVVVLGIERLRIRRSGAVADSHWATILTFRGNEIINVLIIEDLSILLGDYDGLHHPEQQ